MRQGRATVGHPVDVATGAVYCARRDVSIAGKMALVWERRYSTSLLGSPPSPLGQGWSGRYFARLERTPDDILVVLPEGHTVVFQGERERIDGGAVVRDLGEYQELARTGDRYVLTRWDVETGAVERYVFAEEAAGGSWLLAAIEDVAGQGLDLLRDPSGRVTGIRQRLEQRTLALGYDPLGRIDQVSLLTPDGRRIPLVRYAYDSAGCLASAIDAEGDGDRYAYDAGGRLLREVVKGRGEFVFQYDEAGRCIYTSGVDRYDEKSLRFFDAAGWTEVTDSLGEVTRYAWLPSGQITQEMDPLGAIRRTAYDEYGRVVSHTDPGGGTVAYEYDDAGNLCGITDPVGHASAYRFNEHHLPTTLTDAAGGVRRREYDGRNRLVASVDPQGTRWAYSQDAEGNVTRVTAPGGAAKHFRYTANGVLYEETDWEDHPTRYAVDDFGRIVLTTLPGGTTLEHRYDAAGNLVFATFTDGSSLSYVYHEGNITAITDGNGAMTTLRYDRAGRLVERRDRLGGTVLCVWGTERGRLLRVVNEIGETYDIDYDPAGRPVRERGFDGSERTYRYDASGNCVGRSNAAGEEIVLHRDALGRIIREVAPDGSSAGFEYDPFGNLIAAVNETCAVRFERDPLGRVVREQVNEHAVESRFDPTGNLATMATSLGQRIDFEWDGNGQVTAVRIPGRYESTFRRNERGQEISRELPGRTSLASSYDHYGRLVEQRLSTWGPVTEPTAEQPFLRRTWEYDREGAVAAVGDPDGRTEYGYDSVERLLQAAGPGGVEAFTCDLASNPTTRVRAGQTERYEYGRGSRLIRHGDSEYRYDDDGRLAARVDGGGGPQPREWHYAWDALDQLRAVTTPEGEVWRYEYDALGRRVRKRGPGRDLSFVWHGDVLIHEVEDGAARTTWVFEPNSFRPLCTLQGDRALTVVTDHLGTPRELTDAAGGTAWSARYTAWGETRPDLPLASVGCDLRFQGQWFDAESGLHYNRFRYYNPEAGRFISPDPIGLAGGLHAYAYTRNPINWIDPYGLMEGSDPPPLGSSPENPHPTDYRSPERVETGTRRVEVWKVSEGSGLPYRHVSHYDDQGRLVGQTHYTDHGRRDHTNPHHHQRNPVTGERLRADPGVKGSPRNFPGVHPDEPPEEGCG